MLSYPRATSNLLPLFQDFSLAQLARRAILSFPAGTFSLSVAAFYTFPSLSSRILDQFHSLFRQSYKTNRVACENFVPFEHSRHFRAQSIQTGACFSPAARFSPVAVVPGFARLQQSHENNSFSISLSHSLPLFISSSLPLRFIKLLVLLTTVCYVTSLSRHNELSLSLSSSSPLDPQQS